MATALPSGPKPTKEGYLTTLRVLKEQHESAEENHQLIRNSPKKTAVTGKAIICVEEAVNEKAAPVKPTITLTGKSSSTNTPWRTQVSEKVSGGQATSAPAPTPAQPPASTAPPEQSTHSTKVTPSIQSSKKGSQKLKATPAVPPPPAKVKLGRKATRRFTVVAELLPNFKLDKSTKLEVAAKLKEMNCWSDDEPAADESIAEGDDESSDSEDEKPKPADTAITQPLTAQTSTKASSTPAVPVGSPSTKIPPPGMSAKYRKGGSSKHPTPEDPQSQSNTPSIVASNTNATAAALQAAAEKRSGKNHQFNLRPSDGKSSKAHAYLEEQKQAAKLKAKEAMVQKAIKLYVKVRRQETEAHKRIQWATSGKLALERSIINKIANFRWQKIVSLAMPVAVQKRVKMDRRERRLHRRREAAQRVLRHAWRKFRVRFLLGCVVEYIRLKARLFREQEIREEREFRMRTAMRRVREDRQFKEWIESQKEHHTFPVKGETEVQVSLKPTPPTEPLSARQGVGRQDPFQVLFAGTPAEKISSPRSPSKPAGGKPGYQHPPHSGFFITEGTNSSSSNATGLSPNAGAGAGPTAITTSTTAAASAIAPSSVRSNSPRALTSTSITAVAVPAAAPTKSADFVFHRPDLAPFSTMINQMITASVLFKSKQPTDWADLASVGPDYAAQFKNKKKSPAYQALEKLCGVSEAEVMRSQMISRKEGVNLKLKSFGHSIVSL